MRETNIQKQIKNLYNQLGTTQPVATYDPENWNHHLRMYAYNRDGNEIEEKGYYIN